MARKAADLTPEELARARSLYEHGTAPGVIGEELDLAPISITHLARRQRWLAPKKIDKDAVRRDYCSGALTDQEICAKHGLEQRELASMKANGRWTKSLSKRIAQEAEAQIQQEVAKRVAGARSEIIEDAIVEANAALVARITRHHRTGASQTRETCLKLLGEMGILALPADQLRQIAEIAATRQVAGIEDFDEQDKAYQRAVDNFLSILDLGERSKTLKNLVQALGQAIDIERKVYGIKEEATETDVIKTLKELSRDA